MLIQLVAKDANGVEWRSVLLGYLGLFLMGCFLTALIVGLLVCALVVLFGTRAETSAWAAVNFIVMLSGIYYPVSVLPGWAAAIACSEPA